MADNNTQAPAAVNLGPAIDVSKLIAPDMSQYIQAITAAGGSDAKAKFAGAAQAGIAHSIAAVSQQQALAGQQYVDATGAASQAEAGVSAEARRIAAEQSALISSTADAIAPRTAILAKRAKVDALDAQLDKQADDIIKRQSVGILDNPFNWLFDQFALPADIGSYNTLTELRNGISRSADDMMAASTEAANHIKLTNNSITAKLVEEQSKADIANASLKLATAQIVQGQQSIATLKLAGDLVGTTYQEQMANLNYRLSAANFAFRVEYEGPNILQQRKLQAHVLDNQEALKDTLRIVNDKFQTYAKISDGKGGTKIKPLIDENAWSTMAPEQQHALAAVAIAATGNADSTGQRIYTPFQMTQNLQKTGVPLANPVAAKLHNAMVADLADITQEVTKRAQSGDMSLKSPEAMKAAIEARFNNNWQRVNESSNTDKIIGYAAPNYGTLAASIGSGLDNVKLWKNYVSKYAENPRTQQTAPTLASLLTDAQAQIEAKTLTPREAAAGVKAISDAIVAHNARMSDTTIMGLPLPSQFNSPVPEFLGKTFSGGVLHAKGNDRAWLENYFQRQMASGLLQRMGASISSTADNAEQLPVNAVAWTAKNLFNAKTSKAGE